MKRSVANSLVVPPPIGGISLKDPISAQDPLTAIELENLFPNRQSLDLRGGTRISCGNMDGNGITLGKLDCPNGNFRVAADDVKHVYNVTGSSPTNITGAAVLSGAFTYMQQFRDLLYMTTENGGDHVYTWGGTGNIATSGFVGPSGGDAGFGCMTPYKGRIYFIQSIFTMLGTSLWYPKIINAITGDMNEFSFKSQLREGGQALFIGTVTRAKDFSEDELFCIVSTNGEILLYQGDDPEASNWGIIGHYFVPKPLGPRCFFYVGPDLHIWTEQGVVSMRAVMGGQLSGVRYTTISENIDELLGIAATSGYDGLRTWSGVSYPRGNYILLNVPATNNYQYVQNALTGAWTKFTGMGGEAWLVHNRRLYYTKGQKVVLADEDIYDENLNSAGAVVNRNIKVRMAYNYFGDNSLRKKFSQVIPTLYQYPGLDLTIDMNTKFENIVAASPNVGIPDNLYTLYQIAMGLTGSTSESGSLRIDQTVGAARLSIQAFKVLWNDGDIE